MCVLYVFLYKKRIDYVLLPYQFFKDFFFLFFSSLKKIVNRHRSGEGGKFEIVAVSIGSSTTSFARHWLCIFFIISRNREDGDEKEKVRTFTPSMNDSTRARACIEREKRKVFPFFSSSSIPSSICHLEEDPPDNSRIQFVQDKTDGKVK